MKPEVIVRHGRGNPFSFEEGRIKAQPAFIEEQG